MADSTEHDGLVVHPRRGLRPNSLPFRGRAQSRHVAEPHLADPVAPPVAAPTPAAVDVAGQAPPHSDAPGRFEFEPRSGIVASRRRRGSFSRVLRAVSHGGRAAVRENPNRPTSWPTPVISRGFCLITVRRGPCRGFDLHLPGDDRRRSLSGWMFSLEKRLCRASARRAGPCSLGRSPCVGLWSLVGRVAPGTASTASAAREGVCAATPGVAFSFCPLALGATSRTLRPNLTSWRFPLTSP